jgi:hypothetical protein
MGERGQERIAENMGGTERTQGMDQTGGSANDAIMRRRGDEFEPARLRTLMK